MTVSKANFIKVKLWFDQLVDLSQLQQAKSIDKLQSENILNQEQLLFLIKMLEADTKALCLNDLSSKLNVFNKFKNS